MGNKKSITLVVLAVFSMSILLSTSFIIQPSYAIGFFTTSLGTDDVVVPVYQESTNTIWTYDPNLDKLYRINPSTHQVISSHVITQNVSGNPKGLTCGLSFCYTIWDTGGDDRLLGICATAGACTIGSIIGTNFDVNVTNTGANAGLHARDVVTGGIGSVEVWFGVDNCFGVNTNCVVGLSGLPAPCPISGESCSAATQAQGPYLQVARKFGSATTYNLGTNGVQEIVHNGLSGLDQRLGVATGSTFQVYNLNGNSQVCTVGAIGNAWGLDYFNNQWFLVISSGTPTVQIRSTTTCGLNDTITHAELGNPGSANVDLVIDSTINKAIFVSSGSAVIHMNLTSVHSRVATYSGYTHQANADATLDYNVEFDQLIIANQLNVIKFIDFGAPTADNPEQVCIDTNLDGTADLCFTDTNNDGIPDNGALGALGAFRSNANATTLGFQWLCALGFTGCSDQNPKTNGVGYLYLLLLIIFSYALLVFIHYKAIAMINKEHVQVLDAIKVNPVLLLVMLVIDVSIVWKFGWIEDLIAYTLLALMGGLAGYGFYRMIQSRGDN